MRHKTACRTAVGECDCAEVELKGIAGGAADADVGAEAGDDHGLYSPVVQLVGEIRSTEGAVAVLGYHNVAILRLKSTQERGSRRIGRRQVYEISPALLFPEGAPPFIGVGGSDEPDEDTQDVLRARSVEELFQDLQRLLHGRVGILGEEGLYVDDEHAGATWMNQGGERSHYQGRMISVSSSQTNLDFGVSIGILLPLPTITVNGTRSHRSLTDAPVMGGTRRTTRRTCEHGSRTDGSSPTVRPRLISQRSQVQILPPLLIGTTP